MERNELVQALSECEMILLDTEDVEGAALARGAIEAEERENPVGTARRSPGLQRSVIALLMAGA